MPVLCLEISVLAGAIPLQDLVPPQGKVPIPKMQPTMISILLWR